MPMTPRSRPHRPIWRSPFWTPGVCLLLGLLMLIAYTIGGDPGDGVIALAVMATIGAVFVFGGRSDTLRELGGPDRDERSAIIDIRATAFAGSAVITVILGAWLVEVAQGRDGAPYAAVGSVGAVAYLLAVMYLRRRG
jgi:hypothetical protein